MAGHLSSDIFKETEMNMFVMPLEVVTWSDSERPISPPKVPGKLFERVLTRRLCDNLEWEGHYNPAQYGFRRSWGNVHSIAMTSKIPSIDLVSGSRCSLVLQDVSNAFEKVWHLGLQYKFLPQKLPVPVERSLCDFLMDQKARAGATSGPPSLRRPAFRRKVLSPPMLYAVYTKGCQSSIKELNIQYTDNVS